MPSDAIRSLPASALTRPAAGRMCHFNSAQRLRHSGLTPSIQMKAESFIPGKDVSLESTIGLRLDPSFQ